MINKITELIDFINYEIEDEEYSIEEAQPMADYERINKLDDIKECLEAIEIIKKICKRKDLTLFTHLEFGETPHLAIGGWEMNLENKEYNLLKEVLENEVYSS